MKERLKTYFAALTVVLLMGSCIEEYTPSEKDLKNFTGQLYIEGKILVGANSIVYISPTQALDDNSFQSIREAEVRILGEDGFVSEAATYDKSGMYVLNTKNLNPETRYCLQVKYDGDTFESEYQHATESMEIDEVGFTEDTKNECVDIWVSTKGDDKHTPYYMWTFEEDYEVEALINISQMRHTNGMFIIYNPSIYYVSETFNPYRYGWGHNDSHDINIYSTEELSENTVSKHVIHSITMEKPELQTLYAITVHQSNISEQTYEYLKELRSNTQEMGGMFSPMPTDQYGNIVCTSNPERKVRGYVMSAHPKSKRFFIDKTDLKSLRSKWKSGFDMRIGFDNRGQTEKINWEKYYAGWVLLSSLKDEVSKAEERWSPGSADVEQSQSGITHYKPAWWPNDHTGMIIEE